MRELFELVKFIDEPSDDKDEALYLTYQLICKVNFCNLVLNFAIIRIIFLLTFPNDLKLLGFVFEHLDDIDFIFNAPLIFLWLDIFIVGFAELVPKYAANHCDGMVSLLQDLSLDQA
jgi:N-acyl-L-homoserine lactone synthetase